MHIGPCYLRDVLVGNPLALSLYYSVCVYLGMTFVPFTSFQQLPSTCHHSSALYITFFDVTGQQEVRVLTLAEQIIAAIPERIKVISFFFFSFLYSVKSVFSLLIDTLNC